MEKKSTRRILLVCLLGLVFVGCQRTEDANTFDLGETLEISGLGMKIDYPKGWFVEAGDNGVSINEIDGFEHHKDLQIGLTFTPSEEYARALYIFEDMTLSNLHKDNLSFFMWKDPIVVTDVELFGVPAKRVRAEGRFWWEIRYSGIRNDEVFHLVFAAPTEEELDAFQPTIDQILGSINTTSD